MSNYEDEDSEFLFLHVGLQKSHLEAMVYLARHQGLRAGVRPNVSIQQPSEDEDFPPFKRVVFIEYPEKTMAWGFDEERDAAWLNSFPQYES